MPFCAPADSHGYLHWGNLEQCGRAAGTGCTMGLDLEAHGHDLHELHRRRSGHAWLGVELEVREFDLHLDLCLGLDQVKFHALWLCRCRDPSL